MTTYANSALFGNSGNPVYMDATYLNPNAASSTDWATVAANGLQAIVAGKINDKVREEQQQYLIDRGGGAYTVTATGDGMNLLLLVGLAVLLLKD